MSFIDGIRRLQEEWKVDCEQMAIKADVSQRQLFAWLNGSEVPNGNDISRVTHALDHFSMSDSCRRELKSARELALSREVINDSAAAIIIYTRPDGNLLYANEAAARLSETQTTKVTGLTYLEYFSNCKELFQKPFTNTKDGVFYEQEVELPDGRILIRRGREMEWDDEKAFIEYINDATGIRTSSVPMLDLLNRVPLGVGIYDLFPDGHIELRWMNNGFYAMLNEPRTVRDQYLGAEVIHAWHPEDGKALVHSLQESLETNQNTSIDVRLKRNDGSYVWMNVKSSIASRTPLKTSFYLTFTDIQEEKLQEATLLDRDNAIGIALEHEHLYSWVVNYVTGECTLCKPMQRVFALPEVVQNFPQCVYELSNLSQETIRIYQNAITEVKNGAPFVEFEVHGNIGSKSVHWFRFRITSLEKVEGKTVRAIGTCTIIDTEKVMQARMSKEQSAIAREDQGLSAYTIINLNTKQIIDHSALAPNAPIVETTTDYDQNLQQALETVVYPDDQIQFKHIHDIAFLRSEFALGRTAFVIEFRRRQTDGMISWVRNVLHLVEDPLTLDVILYEYCYDINATKSVEVVTNAAILKTFECLASIDLVHNQTTYLSQGNVRQGKQAILADYPTTVKAYILRAVVKEDQEKCFQQTEVEWIKQQLSTQPVYETSYRIQDAEGQIRLIRDRYTYYDQPKQRCLLMRTDITDIIREEEEHRHNQEVVKVMNSIPGGWMTLNTTLNSNGDLSILHCSQGVADLCGYDLETFVQRYEQDLSSIVFGSDLEVLREKQKEVAVNGVPLDLTYRIVQKGGKIQWVRESANRFEDSEGHHMILAMFQNVSEDNQLYQDIIDSSENIIQVIDQDTRDVYYANAKAQEYAGTIAYAGKKCYEFFAHRTSPCEFCNYKDGTLCTKEIQPKADGSTFLVHGSFTQWHGHQVYTEILTDITRQKEMRHDYENYIATITRTATDAAVSGRINVTMDQCVHVSSIYPSLSNIPENIRISEFLNIASSYILDQSEHEEYLHRYSRQAMIEAFHNGLTTIRMQYHSELSDQSLIISECTVHLVQNPENGDIEGIFFARDITEDAIGNQIYHEMLENGYEGIELIDTIRGTCNVRQIDVGVDWKSLNRSINYEASIEEAVQVAIYPEDADLFKQCASLDNLKRELADKQLYAFTIRNLVNGNVEYKKCSYSYIGTGDSTILATIEDITDIVEEGNRQKKLLEDALIQAQAATKAKSAFLSRMSHEIRTPMNAIIGLTGIARENPNDYVQTQESLEKIDISSHYLLALINDILEMNRIESGKMKIGHEVFLFDDLIQGVRTIEEPLAKSSNLRMDIVNHSLEQMDLHYVGDRMRIQQILINLLGNSVKFTKPGGRIRLGITISSQTETETNIVFTVEDTGIGMSKEFQKHMFEAFVQEDSTTTTKYSGSGLGLAISKSLTEAMGGSITCTSFEGIGTTFTVCLPLERLKDYVVEEGTKEETEDFDLTGTHLLLVEDHPMNILVARKILEHQGVEVTVAENGKQAVDTFLQNPAFTFDAILMDIRMPVMDGLEATREIRASHKEDCQNIPILAMTANALDEDRQNSEAAGMNAHLSKPIDPPLLKSTLARCIVSARRKR